MAYGNVMSFKTQSFELCPAFKQTKQRLSFNTFRLVSMCVTIFQLFNLWFLLQNKHKTPTLVLDFSVPANKGKVVNKSIFGSDEQLTLF